MNRMFYLSIVYDADGYDRLDLTKRARLQDLDDLMSEFNNKEEVLQTYLTEYNIDKKDGRLCIVYEDLDVKKKEMDEYGLTGLEYKDQIDKRLTYAHIIPILYKNDRLLNTETCFIEARKKLRDSDIVKSIMQNKKVTRNGKDYYIKTNKRYIFETENEQDILYNEQNTKLAIEEFLVRLKRSNPDDQYFYFRVLMDICGLRKSSKKISNLSVNEKNLLKAIKSKKIDEIEEVAILEKESEDMESFYLTHDLDDVTRLSYDSNRPIGSVGRKKK